MKWLFRKAEGLIKDRDIVYSPNKYRETEGKKVMPTCPLSTVCPQPAQRSPGRIRPQRCPTERAGEHDSGCQRRRTPGDIQQAPMHSGQPGDPASRPIHVQPRGGSHARAKWPAGPHVRVPRRRVSRNESVREGEEAVHRSGNFGNGQEDFWLTNPE